jgi:hypothetical protein
VVHLDHAPGAGHWPLPIKGPGSSLPLMNNTPDRCVALHLTTLGRMQMHCTGTGRAAWLRVVF